MTDSPGLVQSGSAGPNGDVEVDQAMRAACAELAAAGLADIAASAHAHLSSLPGSPTVIVVGDAKRGKSSLVNALLAHPDASPVDVSIAPWAFVRFVPADTSTPDSDAVLLFAGGRQRSIGSAELSEWVTVSGGYVTDPEVDELPIGAQVAIQRPLLPGVTVVDTPAVGILNPNHLRLATNTAIQAPTILLMTCEATAPMTAAELGLLREVGDGFDEVIFAVTKIDENPGHWRSVVGENRRLLRDHAPQFAGCAMVDVSSAARPGLPAGPDESGSALDGSGLAELVGRLATSCGSAEALPAVNGLHIARAGLGRAKTLVDMQRSAVRGGEGAVGELSEQRRVLGEKLDYVWTTELRSQLLGAQERALGALNLPFYQLRARWSAKLANTDLHQLMCAPQLFIAELTADLEALVIDVCDKFVGAVAAMVSNLEIPADLSPVVDAQPVSTTVMGTRSFEAIALLRRAVAMMKDSPEVLPRWLDVTISAESDAVAREFVDELSTVWRVIIAASNHAFDESTARLDALITAAKTAATASAAQRADALADLDTKIQSLDSAIAAVDRQLSRFPTPSADWMDAQFVWQRLWQRRRTFFAS